MKCRSSCAYREGLQKAAATAEQRKIADLYASFMDEPALERLGSGPLNDEFARIEALTDKRAIPFADCPFQPHWSHSPV